MGRRGNGEGSITRHKKSGLYMARYTVEMPDGLRKRKTIYGKEREEVAEQLIEALANRNKGIVFDADNQKLGDYLDRWLNNSVRGSVKPVTFESYARLVSVHIVPALGRMKLKALSPAHLQGFYRAKLDAGLSPRTVQYLHVVLHRALKQALRWGLVARNVAEAVDPPKISKEEISPLSPEQARKLLHAAADDRLGALYVLAVHTGLRQGELLSLKWEDIDLESSVLRVRRTLSSGEFTAPKTAKSRRSVRLSATAVEALKRHSARQADEMTRVRDLYRDQGLVFASEIGTPLNRHNVSRRSFKPLLKRAGLPEIRFHDLRHTAATLLLSKNVNPKVVSEMLGHSTVAVTLDVYSHLLPIMQESAATAMEDALR
jgi:integrase